MGRVYLLVKKRGRAPEETRPSGLAAKLRPGVVTPGFSIPKGML